MSAQQMWLKMAAAGTVILMASATAASAHHCYKDQWAEAAYQHHLAGGTAWMSLSDMGGMFIPEELQADCGWVADAAVADFMEAEGLEQEPLIHSKTVTGGGAHKKGNDPKPFSYLTEDQFRALTISLEDYLGDCAAELEV
ncbi:hypothetical protein [Tessaracoccus sp. G1721]